MKLKEAIEIMERHNIWRRGADTPMECVVQIGKAIDLLIKTAKDYENNSNKS